MQFLLCTDGSYISLSNVLRFNVEFNNEDQRWRIVAELARPVRQGSPSRSSVIITVHVFADTITSREEACAHLRDLVRAWNDGQEPRGASEYFDHKL